MVNCDVCKNLQPARFDVLSDSEAPYGEGVRQIKISRRSLADSAAAGCEGCQIIREARRAIVSGLGFYTDYVCVTETISGAPLRISGLNREGCHKDWSELYMLER